MIKMKIIDNDSEYNQAIKRIEEIFESKPGSDEFEEKRLLVLLIEKYENENSPMADADPVRVLKFLMKQHDLSRKDLEPLIGNKTMISRILNYKIPISRKMAARLSEHFNLSIEFFLRPYTLAGKYENVADDR
jgi:HTH-type transcriptional regulator/antitoxin HigA